MRTKYVKDDEEKMWATVGVNDMSDEEDAGDENGGAFKLKTPLDRSENVALLIKTLDQRHEDRIRAEQRRVMKVPRVVSNSPRKDF